MWILMAGSVLAAMVYGSLWFTACCDPNGSVLAATGCGAYPHHNGSVVAAIGCGSYPHLSGSALAAMRCGADKQTP